jgi:hypothetical protein
MGIPPRVDAPLWTSRPASTPCSEPCGLLWGVAVELSSRAVKAGGAEVLDVPGAGPWGLGQIPVDTMDVAGPSGPTWVHLVRSPSRRQSPRNEPGRLTGWPRTGGASV